MELETGRSDADDAGVGRVVFVMPTNNSSARDVAQIASETDGSTANERGGSLIFSTKADNADGVVQRMAIDKSGNIVINEGGLANSDFRVEGDSNANLLFCDASADRVGIGVSPVQTLHVVGATSANGDARRNVIFQDTGSAGAGLGGGISFGGYYNGTSDFVYDFGTIQGIKENATANDYAGALRFSTRLNGYTPAEGMRLNSFGMLLINATSNINSGGGTKEGLCIRGGGGGPHVVTLRNIDTSGGANQIEFQDGDGDVCGAINANATNNTTSYGTSSDYRLKENVSAVSGAIDKMKLLEPKTYNFISDSSKTKEDGFLAHELAEVIPNAVTGEKDAVHDNGEMDIQQVDYGKLTPLLTAALQEAIEKIETLQAEVAALKGE